MKGIYKTKEGSKVEVVNFDEANKIAMIKVDELQNRWVSENEYSTWEKEGEEEEHHGDTGEVVLDYLTTEEVPEEIPGETMSGIEHCPITEEPKKKKTATKKAAPKKKTK